MRGRKGEVVGWPENMADLAVPSYYEYAVEYDTESESIRRTSAVSLHKPLVVMTGLRFTDRK